MPVIVFLVLWISCMVALMEYVDIVRNRPGLEEILKKLEETGPSRFNIEVDRAGEGLTSYYIRQE